MEANRAGCVNYFTLRRHHYCASRDQTIREGRPASLDLGPIWRPTTCWEIVRLLGRVLIHAQIAMLRSRWNVLAIAAFFFSHWATAAEKGDDRVSDIHADRHEIISHNGSSGFGGNADSAETADLARVHHLVLSNRYFCLRLSKKASLTDELCKPRWWQLRWFVERGESPDDRLHRCAFNPVASEFEPWGYLLLGSKPKTRCFFAPMHSS